MKFKIKRFLDLVLLIMLLICSPFVKISASETTLETPTVSLQPKNREVYMGELEPAYVSMSFKTVDDATKSYQWYESLDGETFQLIEGAVERTYTPVNDNLGVKYYYCIGTATLDGQSASVQSDIATYTVKNLEDRDGELWDGTGTEDDPFILKSYEDLQKIKKYVNEEGFCFSYVTFKMANDIELAVDFGSIGGIKPGETSTGSGTNIYPFSGVLDGDNHTISYAYGTTNALFQYVREATVKNLNIYGEYINNYGLVGSYIIDYGVDGNYNEGTGGSYAPGCPDTILIDNVTIKNGTSISKSGFIGGSASGGNVIQIRNCAVESGVKIGWDAKNNQSSDNSQIGSFAGSFNGHVANCISFADVYGNEAVGGLVGKKAQTMAPFDVKNSSFHGNINATGDFAGGIVGKGYTLYNAPNTPSVSIENCYVTGNIQASDSVGGIFGGEGGQLQSWDNGIGYIRNNCFTGKVSATGEGNYVGGICGFMRSLNRYNVIENNYYIDNCGADRGISGVLIVDTSAAEEHPVWVEETCGNVFYIDSSVDDLEEIDAMFEQMFELESVYHYIARTSHNRSDKPLGEDKDILAKAMSEESFADGTVVEALNASDSSMKNWTQGEGGFPVHNDMPIVTELSVFGDYRTDFYIGEELDLSGMVITATWSDGTITTPSLNDVAISGYDNTSRGKKTLTIGFGAAKVNLSINILKRAATTIKVTFTLFGDSVHDSDTDGKIHTLSNNNLEVWIPEATYEVDLNATVKDVLEYVLAQNGMSCSNPGGNYVESITKDGVTLAEFDNGLKSGWMYTLNGTHPLFAVNEQFLEDGDVIVFHYTDDYTIEEGSETFNPVHSHNLVKTEAKDATETTAGNIEFYTCETCGKVFSDVNGTTEITVAQTKIPATGTSGNTDKQVSAPKTVKLSKTSMTYTGKALKPAVKVTDVDGNVIDSSDYKITYKNNKKVGTAKVIVTFRNDYASFTSMSKTFKIVPIGTSIKSLIKGNKQIKVTWRAQKKQTTGYQIQYSTSKKFTKKTTKSVTVKVGKTSTTLKNLKAKKTYYVRIRTYKKVGKKTYNSVWSKVKSVKTK